MSPLGSDAAEHIFNWCRNSQELYRRMIGARAFPEGRNFSSSRAMQVFQVACLSWAEMKRAHEANVADYQARDILAAAILMLEWDEES